MTKKQVIKEVKDTEMGKYGDIKSLEKELTDWVGKGEIVAHRIDNNDFNVKVFLKHNKTEFDTHQKYSLLRLFPMSVGLWRTSVDKDKITDETFYQEMSKLKVKL